MTDHDLASLAFACVFLLSIMWLSGLFWRKER